MQANNGSIITTVIVCAVVLGLFTWIIIPDVPEFPEIDVPTADAIAAAVLAGVDIPEVDTAKLDKVCELTDGCEFYEGSIRDLDALDNDEAADDFIDELSDLIGLDKDEFKLGDDELYNLAEDMQDEDNSNDLLNTAGTVDYKDSQIRAYSKQDKKDGNWEIKTFLRVEYHDIDEDVDDNEFVYVVVTSVLDEGDYDSLSIEQVSRNFEFD